MTILNAAKGVGRSYRCFYTPKDALGHLTPSESGALPFVQLQALNGEAALIGAQHITGCPVSEVVRIEPAAVIPQALPTASRVVPLAALRRAPLNLLQAA